MRFNKFHRACLACFLGLVLLWGTSGTALSATKVLALTQNKQQKTYWCWAACTGAIMKYYGKSIKQCYIADYAFPYDDCCKTPDNRKSPCNNMNTIEGIMKILSHWCFGSTRVDSFLTFTACKTEINANRPFIVAYRWTKVDMGHVVVVYGYSENLIGANQKLYVMDPWAQMGILDYSYVKSAANHTWTHTVKKIQKTAPAADWTMWNSTPTHGSACAGGTPAWQFQVKLTETIGGCGKVVKFWWDFYNSSGVFINRQYNSAADFAAWFSKCVYGDSQLPKKTAFCANLCTYLGGRTSGYVKLTLQILCDNGVTKIETTPKIHLSSTASPPTAQRGEFKMPTTGPVR